MVPTNIGLHRCPPTYPPRNALRRFAFARNGCSPIASSRHPLAGPDFLANLSTARFSGPVPLLHRWRIPFVRAPEQDLRPEALTSDLLAMSVTRAAMDNPVGLSIAALLIFASLNQANLF